MKKYRGQGLRGAILDEYERALKELIALISPLSVYQLTYVVDSEAADPDCRSIQTILTHVVNSGYGYATALQNHLGENLPYRDRETLDNAGDYVKALLEMFAYNEITLEAYPDMVWNEHDPAKKILTRNGQIHDAEQLTEHAIVHILRHRRQIERFLLRILNQ